MTDYVLRPITNKDNQAMKTIIQDSLESYGLAIPGTAYFDPELGFLSTYYKKTARSNYWVIEKEGEVVGGCGIAPYNESNDTAELQKLYIKPSEQGKGYSSVLIKQAIEFAKENHYASIYIETSSILEKANQIYPRFGFTQLKRALLNSKHTEMDRWFLLDLKENI